MKIVKNAKKKDTILEQIFQVTKLLTREIVEVERGFYTDYATD